MNSAIKQQAANPTYLNPRCVSYYARAVYYNPVKSGLKHLYKLITYIWLKNFVDNLHDSYDATCEANFLKSGASDLI